ncbi:MAG: amidohydrolase family protein [Deltaproteobacteria bacterium]|nr:amidohydrolase family protein [Deltaproteobacteria bacterium]
MYLYNSDKKIFKINSKFILTNLNLPAPFLLKDAELSVNLNTGKIISADKNKNYPKAISANNNYNYSTLIIPGLINAHIHTELTMAADKNTPHIFSEWVISLIKRRTNLSDKEIADIRQKAYNTSIRAGVTAIGDIVPISQFNKYISDYKKFNEINCSALDFERIHNKNKILKYTKSDAAHSAAGCGRIGNNNNDIFSTGIPRVKAYIEIIGLDPSLSNDKIKELKDILKNDINKNDTAGNNYKKFISIGVSPHSIYSVSPALFKILSEKNKQWGLDLTVHASEHKSEIQFLSEGIGDISENLLAALNLKEFNNPSEKYGIKYSTPVQYLKSVGILSPKTSLIHANEVNGDDIKTIKDLKSSVIHCPRSNSFFKSNKLPLRKILDNNIIAGLGTDSLYSNDSISILDELKYARKIHNNLQIDHENIKYNDKDLIGCGISSKELFEMATKNNAKILNIPFVTGTLEKNSYADFVIFKIPENLELNEINVFDEIINLEEKDILKVFIGGKEIYCNGNNN